MRDGSAELAMTQASTNQFLEERRRTRRFFNRVSPVHGEMIVKPLREAYGALGSGSANGSVRGRGFGAVRAG